jgi:hypothetical protein
MSALARCEAEMAYFRRLLMTGERSYFMPAHPSRADLVLDMTMAAVALADWQCEAELISAADQWRDVGAVAAESGAHE